MQKCSSFGIEVSRTTVAKYKVKHLKPASQTLRTFLQNHVKNLVSVNFFVVPTVTFRALFVFLVLAHERRRVLHFDVIEHPTAEWTAAQLVQAFPWDTAPPYLLRDRDRVFGDTFRMQAASMQIIEVLTAPRSPWQSPYVQRLIGSIRRECLDHVVVLDEESLRRMLRSHIDYYHGSRCHLALNMDFLVGTRDTGGHFPRISIPSCLAAAQRSSSSEARGSPRRRAKSRYTAS